MPLASWSQSIELIRTNVISEDSLAAPMMANVPINPSIEFSWYFLNVRVDLIQCLLCSVHSKVAEAARMD